MEELRLAGVRFCFPARGTNDVESRSGKGGKLDEGWRIGKRETLDPINHCLYSSANERSALCETRSLYLLLH